MLNTAGKGEGDIVHLGVLAWISLLLQLLWPHPNLTLLARQELGSLLKKKKRKISFDFKSWLVNFGASALVKKMV